MVTFRFSNPLPHLRRIYHHNVETFKSSPMAEISGSLGDLGTLLPLMTALVLTGSISLPSTLLFTGAANVLTGVAFGIPLPVQPMKAIAAVAIARKFTMEENAAAGLVVAALVGLLSVTGGIKRRNRVTPVPVIKGIQVGAGLSLCISAGTSLLKPLSWTGPAWNDNLIWAIAAAAFLLCTLAFPKLPYALVVFAIGIILSLLSESSGDEANPVSGPAIPIVIPSYADIWKATTTAALGQLPLTLLNSVIAVHALCSDLLPSPPHPPAPKVTSIGISVSLVNLVGCWFGAMPACHGSGGLAGQYRFGARSGSSIIILGAVKFGLGLIALSSPGPIISTLSGIPKSLLGILVLAAGLELAKVGESLNTDARDLRILDSHQGWDGKQVREVSETERKERWMVMLVTVATLLAFKNDAVGFAAGMVWWWGIKGAKRVVAWREERERSRERAGLGLERRPSIFGRHRGHVRSGTEERLALLRHEESDRVA